MADRRPPSGILTMTNDAQVQELLEKLTVERDRLLSVLEGLSEEEAGASPKPEEWTAKQQMSHLCEMETMYRAWLGRALEEDGANLDGIRGEPVAIPLERAHLHSVSDHVAEMRQQRKQTLVVMEQMRPQDYDRKASNSLFGTLTLLQWLRSYYRHDRMHYDQVRGEEPSYRPRFRSGQEPDQRRPSANIDHLRS